MSDQLIDSARKAAEEIRECIFFDSFEDDVLDDIVAVIERHMRECGEASKTEIPIDVLNERDVELISRAFTRNEELEHTLSDIYTKLEEVKEIFKRTL